MVKYVLALAGVTVLIATFGRAQEAAPVSKRLPQVDHLVYAGPDLKSAVDQLEQRLGIRATPGGQHLGRGTRNYLIALGPTVYLEIIGPDPDQPAPAMPRTFGIDALKEARLVTWAAKGADLPRLARDAASHGIILGQVSDGSRKRPDGMLLKWQFTSPLTVVADGIVPFFIDWGTTEHPARSAAAGATLVTLRAEHPAAETVQAQLRQLGLDLPVSRGSRPALIAAIDSPKGRVELR